jgi:hypothetical protein
MSVAPKVIRSAETLTNARGLINLSPFSSRVRRCEQKKNVCVYGEFLERDKKCQQREFDILWSFAVASSLINKQTR